MKTKNLSAARYFAVLGVAALAGCATNGGVSSKAATSGADPSVLKTRSVERWNFLIANNAAKAYDYLTPGFRSTKSRDDYAKEMNGRAMRWTSAAYLSQECETDKCTVKLSVGYKVNLGGPAGTVNSSGPVTETWIKTSGSWYMLPDALQSQKLQTHTEP